MPDQDLLFSEGDVVRLKSGGPDMTVTGAAERQFTAGSRIMVYCEWLEDGGKHRSKQFSAALLEPAT